jgi:hypothetical protein
MVGWRWTDSARLSWASVERQLESWQYDPSGNNVLGATRIPSSGMGFPERWVIQSLATDWQTEEAWGSLVANDPKPSDQCVAETTKSGAKLNLTELPRADEGNVDCHGKSQSEKCLSE